MQLDISTPITVNSIGGGFDFPLEFSLQVIGWETNTMGNIYGKYELNGFLNYVPVTGQGHFDVGYYPDFYFLSKYIFLKCYLSIFNNFFEINLKNYKKIA